MSLEIALGLGKKLSFMNIIRILVAVGCVLFVLKTFLRMIWLFRPELFQHRFFAPSKEVRRSEMVVYYLAGIIASLYYIFSTLDRLNLLQQCFYGSQLLRSCLSKTKPLQLATHKDCSQSQNHRNIKKQAYYLIANLKTKTDNSITGRLPRFRSTALSFLARWAKRKLSYYGLLAYFVPIFCACKM